MLWKFWRDRKKARNVKTITRERMNMAKFENLPLCWRNVFIAGKGQIRTGQKRQSGMAERV